MDQIQSHPAITVNNDM